jgi:hypothetical protein
MRMITVNGVRLAYDESGAGPPAVWVHGDIAAPSSKGDRPVARG